MIAITQHVLDSIADAENAETLIAFIARFLRELRGSA